MKQIYRLSALFFFVVAVGCSTVVPVRAPEGAAMTAQDAVGLWTLCDDENAAFDVRLSASGSAISNWSKGSVGARGEWGRWVIIDGSVVIDYDDGWRDIVFRNDRGWLRKKSYSPDMARDGPARSESSAVRTAGGLAAWVGVYEVAAAGSRTGTAAFVAIQSTGLAWNTADPGHIGSWWMAGDALRVRWANGWIDEFRQGALGFELRSWRPVATFDALGTPGEPAAHTARATRVE